MRCLDGIADALDMFEQTPRDREGQGGLACCSPWGPKESDLTERLSSDKFSATRGALSNEVTWSGVLF